MLGNTVVQDCIGEFRKIQNAETEARDSPKTDSGPHSLPILSFRIRRVWLKA